MMRSKVLILLVSVFTTLESAALPEILESVPVVSTGVPLDDSRALERTGERGSLKRPGQFMTQLPCPQPATTLVAQASRGDLPGIPVYTNVADPVLYFLRPGAARLLADDMYFGAGVGEAGCAITYYDLLVMGADAHGQPVGGTFDVHVELYSLLDGCSNPNALTDDSLNFCCPDPIPIPGTEREFFGVPGDANLHLLPATFDPPVPVPGGVWMGVTFSSDDAGWIIAENAELGLSWPIFVYDHPDMGCTVFFFDYPPPSFWANIRCAPEGSVALVPVDATGPELIVGNQITIPHGGQDVTLELRASGWDPQLLAAYEVTVDSSGFTSGEAGSLSVADPASDAFIDTARTDFTFFGLEAVTEVDTIGPDFRYAGNVVAAEDSVPDPGIDRYAGTLVLHVSDDARGTFTVGLLAHPDSSMANDGDLPIAPLDLKPALITVDAQAFAVPTVSQWGLVVLALLLLTAGKLGFRKSRCLYT